MPLLPSVHTHYQELQKKIRSQIHNVLTQTCKNHYQETHPLLTKSFSKKQMMKMLELFYQQNPYLEETLERDDSELSSCSNQSSFTSQLFTQLATEIMSDIDKLYEIVQKQSRQEKTMNHYNLQYLVDVLFITLLSLKHYYLDKSMNQLLVVNIPPSRISILVDKGYNIFKDKLLELCTGNSIIYT